MLDKNLLSDDNVLRTKVLLEVNEDFHQADLVNQALDSNILASLVLCFKDQDDVIRELASRAVLKVTNVEMGRVVFVANTLVQVTASLFDDPVKKIRHNAYTCLINLAQFTFGI